MVRDEEKIKIENAAYANSLPIPYAYRRAVEELHNLRIISKMSKCRLIISAHGADYEAVADIDKLQAAIKRSTKIDEAIISIDDNFKAAVRSLQRKMMSKGPSNMTDEDWHAYFNASKIEPDQIKYILGRGGKCVFSRESALIAEKEAFLDNKKFIHRKQKSLR